MATRLKTIEYPLLPILTNTGTSGSGGTATFSQITIYIPETTSRTFVNVMACVYCRQNNTTALNLTLHDIGITLDSVAESSASISRPFSQTGENQTYFFTRDATAYFNTNFGSGTSQTCDIAFDFNNGVMNNIQAKLIITYSYDDSSENTRIKTVRIPLESYNNQLTNTSSLTLGTSQVPALDSFLPEASKIYRAIWFEVIGNEKLGSTTDGTYYYELDSEGETTRSTIEAALNSSCWYYDLWIRNDMDTSSSHDFKVRSDVAARFACPGAILCVTYEYDHSSTTSVLNSIILPACNPYTDPSGTTSADAHAYSHKFQIQEPGTITLKQSAIVFYGGYSGAFTIWLKTGSQSYAQYTVPAGSTTCGQYSWIHRVDSGGRAAADGITLARGENEIITTWYTSTGYCNNICGIFYLNYTSSVHDDGDEVHNKTIFNSIYHTSETLSIRTQTDSAVAAISIPETSYYLNGALVWTPMHTATSTYALFFYGSNESGEFSSDGYSSVGGSIAQLDNEFAITWQYFDFTNLCKLYPGDSRPFWNIETVRDWCFLSLNNIYCNAQTLVTYHSIVYTIAGSISNYSGDGSGITVDAFRVTDGKYIDSATSTTGGSYSITWYDDTDDVFVTAREDSTHMGRSDDGTAV